MTKFTGQTDATFRNYPEVLVTVDTILPRKKGRCDDDGPNGYYACRYARLVVILRPFRIE